MLANHGEKKKKSCEEIFRFKDDGFDETGTNTTAMCKFLNSKMTGNCKKFPFLCLTHLRNLCELKIAWLAQQFSSPIASQILHVGSAFNWEANSERFDTMDTALLKLYCV